MKRFPPFAEMARTVADLRGSGVAGARSACPCARAEYMVLQSGQRIHVTGYERVGETLRLTMAGGTLEIPADSLLRVDPEDIFCP